MPNGKSSWRSIRLALRIRPPQIRNAAVSGAPSSAAPSTRRRRPTPPRRSPPAPRRGGGAPAGGEVQGEATDPQEPVEGVADAQRAEFPGLLEQALHTS